MYEPIFIDKSHQPDESGLQSVMGRIYPYFQSLVDQLSDYLREWKFYNTKSGWVLKILDKKKAICYLKPLNDSFLYSSALRESEHEILLKSDLPGDVMSILKDAKKYPEGYQFLILVEGQSQFETVRRVLEILGRVG